MFAFVSALVALPLLAQSALAADCTRSYTVKAGDWCDKISSENHVSTYQLAALNPSINTACDNLQPGQLLCLGKAGEDCATTYVVKPNDTCDLIASQTGTNSTILWANNPQINAGCTNLYIDEVLCVASTFGAPTVPAGSPVPAATPPPTAVPANPSPRPTTVQVVTSHALPAVPTTPAPATTTPAPAPAPSSSSVDDGSDDNDDDLPFCDEL
jgi:LysM repeat protein